MAKGIKNHQHRKKLRIVPPPHPNYIGCSLKKKYIYIHIYTYIANNPFSNLLFSTNKEKQFEPYSILKKHTETITNG